MAKPVRVAAIVVTFNRRDVLAVTLKAIMSQERPADLLFVVDNDSQDGTREMVEAEFPQAIHVRMPDNLGFAAGLAEGMTRALERGADFCWLLDDDSRPSPPALRRLLEATGSVARLGILGTSGGMLRWGVPDRRPGRLRRAPVRGSSRLYRCDFALVDGALVARSAIEAAGVPRKDFFMMFEDIEYTSRVRRAGWQVLLLDEDLIQREYLGSGGPAAGGSAPPWRGYYQARNHLAVALDHGSIRELLGAVYRQMRIIGATVLRDRSRPWHRARLRLLGLWHGFRGRMGKTLDPAEHP